MLRTSKVRGPQFFPQVMIDWGIRNLRLQSGHLQVYEEVSEAGRLAFSKIQRRIDYG